jgi:hypothetical protein
MTAPRAKREHLRQMRGTILLDHGDEVIVKFAVSGETWRWRRPIGEARGEDCWLEQVEKVEG